MIKINLLPIRASKKKETMRQQVSILILSVAGVLIVGLSLYAMLLTRINTTKADIERSENDLKTLKAKIGAIDNIKKLQADVKRKLDVLNKLRHEKKGPASRLAALSDAVPEKLWLTRYTETGTTVNLGGVAYNEDLIALFIKNLQGSGAFNNIELQVSQQVDLANVKAKQFELIMQIKQ